MTAENNHCASAETDTTDETAAEQQRKLLEAYTDAVSRRKFIAAAGGASVTGLAGCNTTDDTSSPSQTTTEDSGDGGTGTETVTGTGAEKVDETLVGHMWGSAKEAQFNRWNTSNRMGHFDGHVWDDLAYYNPLEQEWVNEMAESFEYDPDAGELQVTLRDAKWHNGKDVTTKDISVGNEIDYYMTYDPEKDKPGGIWEYVDSIERPDGTNIVYKVPGTVNSDLLFNSVLTTTVRTPRFVYQQWLDRFEEADGDQEKVNKVKSELAEWTWSEPIGNGVWKPTDLTTQWAKLEPFEPHQYYDDINYKQLKLLVNTSNKKNWSALKAGKQDAAAVAMPGNVYKAMPNSLWRYTYVGFFGSGIGFNFDHPVYGNHKVRQAIAYIISNQPAATNAGGYEAAGYSGLAGNFADVPKKILGDVYGKLTSYDQNFDAAAKLLREEGFSKQDGAWHRPNGDVMKAPVIVISGHTDMVKMFQTVVAQLKEFGLDATLNTLEGASFWDSWSTGDFAMSESFWANPWPYHAYAYYWQHSGPKQGTFGWPRQVEGVPEPFTGNGSTTIDCSGLLSDLAKEPDETGQRKIIQKLAWTFNHSLPIYPIEERRSEFFMNNKGWDIPDPSGSVTQMGLDYLVDSGIVSADSS